MTDEHLALAYLKSYIHNREVNLMAALETIEKILGTEIAQEISEDKASVLNIKVWFIGIGVLPLFNMKEFKKTAIYGQVVLHGAKLLKVEEEWLHELLTDFIIKAQSYEHPQGMLADWLLDRLFDNADDIRLRVVFDDIGTNSIGFDWKRIAREVTVIPA